jgi:hypothetical protein
LRASISRQLILEVQPAWICRSLLGLSTQHCVPSQSGAAARIPPFPLAVCCAHLREPCMSGWSQRPPSYSNHLIIIIIIRHCLQRRGKVTPRPLFSFCAHRGFPECAASPSFHALAVPVLPVISTQYVIAATVETGVRICFCCSSLVPLKKPPNPIRASPSRPESTDLAL